MKKLLGLCAAVTMLAGLPALAAPISIFSDNFNRTGTSVGNGWLEVEPAATDGSVLVLGLSATGTANVTQGTQTLSTIGLTNIVLGYDWQGIATEENDFLRAYYSLNGTDFFLLGSHALSPIATNLTHASWNLPTDAEGKADISIRLELLYSMGNDGVRIDNVSLTGVAAVPGPMVGAGLPGLLAFGGLLMWWRRRRTAPLSA